MIQEFYYDAVLGLKYISFDNSLIMNIDVLPKVDLYSKKEIIDFYCSRGILIVDSNKLNDSNIESVPSINCNLFNCEDPIKISNSKNIYDALKVNDNYKYLIDEIGQWNPNIGKEYWELYE